MIVRRLARPFLSAIFISGGINSLRYTEGHAEMVKPFVDKTVGKQADMLPSGVPTDPQTLVRVDGTVKLVGGAMLALGKFPRLSSLLLLPALGWTTAAAHRFWDEKDPSQRQTEMTQFLKNTSLAGGLLLAMTDTGGKPSVGWRAKRAAGDAGQQVQSAAGTVQQTVGKAAGRAEKATGKAGGKAGRKMGKAGRTAGMMQGRARRGAMKARKSAARR